MRRIPDLIGAENAAALKRCLAARYGEICRQERTEAAWGELLALVLDCEELYHGAEAPAGGKA